MSRRDAAEGRTMEMMVYNLVKADSDYLEIFYRDGESVELTRKLEAMIAEARHLGAEQYKRKLIAAGKFIDSKKKSRS